MILSLAILAAAVSCTSGQAKLDFLSEEFIERSNRRNFNNDTPPSRLKGLLGLKATEIPSNLETMYHDDNGDDPPEEFDSRKERCKCESIREIRDQSKCGSSWAVSSVSVMSDRVCVHSYQKNQLKISSAGLLECCWACGNGCHGGSSVKAFEYWKEEGVVSGGEYNSTNGCKPYPLPGCDHHIERSSNPCTRAYYTPTCKKECDKDSQLKYKKDKHRGKKMYRLSQDERQIQMKLIKNGPVFAGFSVYTDFYNYKSGVYMSYNQSQNQGSHAVRIIGYGVEDDQHPYWLATNSWNEHWGDNGLFKVLRGGNECGIEERVVAGLPL
nr:unnamed protein product [Callosobruchus analis]